MHVFSVIPGGLCKEAVAVAYDPDVTYDWYEAVSACEGANIGGYNDWYLPDDNELVQLHTELYDEEMGKSIDNKCYWSSDEINSDARVLWFSGGYVYLTASDKSSDTFFLDFGDIDIYGFYVIAVRTFKLATYKSEPVSEPTWVRTMPMTCWLTLANDVRTRVIASQDDIFIPELSFKG